MNLKNSFDRVFLASLFLVALGATAAHAQYSWTGAVSNDPSLNGNYSGGTAPTIGSGTNSQGVWTTSTVSMNFTTAGTTVLGTGTSVSSLNWLGQGSNSTVNVSAGTVDYNGGWVNDGGTESVWVGNGNFNTSNITINGGTVNVLNGTLLGRDNAGGDISVTNGSYTTGAFNSSIGLSFNLQDNFGNGLVTIGNGGLFDVAAAALQPIMFQTLTVDLSNTTSSYINFTSGSTGTLQLNLSTATLGASYLNDLVTNGYVEIGGTVDKTLTDYSFNTTTLADSTLSLAAPAGVPEPSTWALMVGGLVTLGFIARRRAKV